MAIATLTLVCKQNRSRRLTAITNGALEKSTPTIQNNIDQAIKARHPRMLLSGIHRAATRFPPKACGNDAGFNYSVFTRSVFFT